MLRKILSCALALALVALPAHAAKVSATSTSASVSLGARTSLLVVNCGTTTGCTSANKVYVKFFRCGETVAAITATETDERIIRLEPGESVSATSTGWCGFSYITAAAETATVKYWAQ